MATKSKTEDQPAPFDWDKANREYVTPNIGAPDLMRVIETHMEIARDSRLKKLARRNPDVAYLMGQ